MDRHWRLMTVLDVAFLVGFWLLATHRDDGWSYFLAIGWTLRTGVEWSWAARRRRARGARAEG